MTEHAYSTDDPKVLAVWHDTKADHQPPDVRHALVEHGLPRHSCMAEGGAGFRLRAPRLFEHDGLLWACYEGEPGRGVLDDGVTCTWTRRNLSEYYTAREAFDAARKSEGGPAGEGMVQPAGGTA